MLTDKQKALLNKIYRAVHDCVCPKCGHDMIEPTYFPRAPETMYYNCKNGQCDFRVHADEMKRMRIVVMEWGAEAVSYFEAWREGRP